MTCRFLQPSRLVAAPLFAALAACGGGTDGTGAVPGPTTAVTSSGTMTKGSVILNGIRFDDSATLVGDDRGRTAAQLASGMVVALRGRSDDGVTGAADRLQIENEARGPVQSIDALANPQRFTIGGLTVLVDAQTLYANVAGFAGLVVGGRVEVHGLRDAAGNLRATRVEAVGAAEGLDELRGRVSNLNTATRQFTLNGGIAVNYGGAVFSPAGTTDAALGAGVLVEVRGASAGNVFTATQIDVENLEDVDLRGNANEKQEVEGFVTGFTVHPGTFQVNGRSVTTTAATVFVNGAAADLADNVEVEAEGTIDGAGVLVAARVKFEHTRVLLHGLATAVNTGARTVVVLGQTVQANDLTRIDTRVNGGGNSTSLADLTAGVDCVEVRGFVAGTALVADEIREPSGCNRDLVQARVTGENDATFTLTFFPGLTAALGGAGVQFRDAADQPITRAAFFAAVNAAGATTAGTLVKVRGTLNAGVLVAEEAEIEN